MRNPNDLGVGQKDTDVIEAALGFEQATYPNATPETQRLLVHARGVIRKFLESDFGRMNQK